MTLAERLRERIRRDGPLSFRDWMEACLYDLDEGYYMRPGRKTGADAATDFATNPTLHPFFAQCVAREVLEARQALGEPEEFAVFEFGGGEGDLARDAQAWLRHRRVEVPWYHIETSPHHRQAQAGGGAVNAIDAIGAIDALPQGATGMVVAHEFLDALPLRWLERSEAGWSEVFVDWQDGFVERLLATSDVPPFALPIGQRVAWMQDAEAWLEGVAAVMPRGRVLVVDYGREAPWRAELHGTVRTFRRHQQAGSPLDAPGDKDITASVDFAWLREAAAAVGLPQLRDESQEAFLLRHHVLSALNALDRDSASGASEYLRLRHMLIPHGGGMGDAFRVALFERAA